MGLELVILPRARKDLAGLPHADRDRIKVRIEAYAENPDSRHHDVVPMVGTRGGFRLRTGDWRAIFVVADGRLEVVRVLHRREAYR